MKANTSFLEKLKIADEMEYPTLVVNGLEFRPNKDYTNGTIFYNISRTIKIYATLFWEDFDGICIDIFDDEDYSYSEIKLPNEDLNLKLWYKKQMENFIKTNISF